MAAGSGEGQGSRRAAARPRRPHPPPPRDAGPSCGSVARAALPATPSAGSRACNRPRRAVSRVSSSSVTSSGVPTRYPAAVSPSPTFTPTSPGRRRVNAVSSVTSSPTNNTASAPSRARSVSIAAPLLTCTTAISSTALPSVDSTPGSCAGPVRTASRTRSATAGPPRGRARRSPRVCLQPRRRLAVDDLPHRGGQLVLQIALGIGELERAVVELTAVAADQPDRRGEPGHGGAGRKPRPDSVARAMGGQVRPARGPPCRAGQRSRRRRVLHERGQHAVEVERDQQRRHRPSSRSADSRAVSSDGVTSACPARRGTRAPTGPRRGAWTWRRRVFIRLRASSGGISSARATAALTPSVSCGFISCARSARAAAPVNRESTSRPPSSWRQATYSLATRFMPSHSGVTSATAAAR